MTSDCDVQVSDESDQTELVSAILSQNGHGSQSLIPKVSHVLSLMTFTPEPLSIMFQIISLPLIITMMVWVLVSTTIGPSSRSEKNVGVGSGFGAVNVVLRPSVNRGTNCNMRPNGSTIFGILVTPAKSGRNPYSFRAPPTVCFVPVFRRTLCFIHWLSLSIP